MTASTRWTCCRIWWILEKTEPQQQRTTKVMIGWTKHGLAPNNGLFSEVLSLHRAMASKDADDDGSRSYTTAI